MESLEQRLWGVARENRDALLSQDRSGVDTFVDFVHRDAGLGRPRRERIGDSLGSRKRRQQRRVDVDHPPREPRQEACCEELHVAGADDELDTPFGEPARHCPVALVARAEGVELEHGMRNSGCLGTLEGVGPGNVARHGDDRQLCVEQGLEIRPRARDENADQSAKATPSTPASTRPITASPASAA